MRRIQRTAARSIKTLDDPHASPVPSTKQEDHMREQVIKVRLSDREAEELRRAADALGMPPATWLRMIANKELSK